MSSAKPLNVTWIIENYSLLCRSILKSPNLISSNISNPQELYLVLLPNTEGNDEDGHVCISLCSNTDERKYRYAELSAKMIDSEGKIIASVNRASVKVKWFVSAVVWVKVLRVDQLKQEVLKWKADNLTIECQIFIEGTVPDTIELTNSQVRTNIGFDRYSFSTSTLQLRKSVSWECKKTEAYDDMEFSIKITKLEENILINFKFNPLGNNRSINCTVSLFNLKNLKLMSKTDTKFFSHRTDTCEWNFPPFLSEKELSGKESKYLLFDILFSNESVTHCMETSNDVLQFNEVTALQNDLRDMYVKEKHPDVKLKVKDETFNAHKCILSARSPVFSAMFERNLLENQTGVVEIKDMDEDSVKLFLEFLYTGTVSNLDYHDAVALLLAAEKYEVPSLKEKCAIFLQCNIADQNVGEILYVSDLVTLESLKESAFDYIVRNSGRLMCSEEWLQWSKEHALLAVQILPRLASYAASKTTSKRSFVSPNVKIKRLASYAASKTTSK